MIENTAPEVPALNLAQEPEEPQREDHPQSWLAYAWTWLEDLADSLGGLATLAGRMWVRGPERNDILAWLRPAERLTRLALLVLALDAPAPLSRRHKGIARKKQPVAPSHDATASDADDPQSWRVSFAIGPHPRRPAQTRAWRSEPRLLGGRPLALRMEALRRVLADPLRAARKLRRRLDANNALAQAMAMATHAGSRDHMGERIAARVMNLARSVALDRIMPAAALDSS